MEGDLLAGAIAFAERVAETRPLPRIRDLTANVDKAKIPAGFFEKAAKDAAAKARGGYAPVRCVEAVKAAVELPFDAGIKRERELFEEALASTESKALRHVFFAERTAAKIPDIASDTPTLPIRRVAVLGAGTMGGGIAMVFANAGISVVLVDREQSFVDKGLGIIQKNYAATVSKGKLAQSEMDARVGRISGTTDWNGLGDVDLVIEAVFEEMGLKREIFGKLDKICRKDAILATNTSTLDVNEIARSTSRPEQVIGLHFFSPANVMRLLEIVRGKETSKTVVATSLKLSKQIGKVGVLVGVCPGFVGNRMLHTYGREAQLLIQEGALPQQVDGVLTKFGFAMGPCQTSDLAGIDVGWRIRKEQPKPPPGERYSGAVGDRLAEMGRFGQKTNAGFYKYEAGQPDADPRPGGRGDHRGRVQGARHRAPRDQRRRDLRAVPLLDDQRGGEDPRRRHRAPRLRHRHRLDQRVRLSSAPRRPHVLCRHSGPLEDPWSGREVRRQVRQRLETLGAAREAGQSRPNLRLARRGQGMIEKREQGGGEAGRLSRVQFRRSVAPDLEPGFLPVSPPPCGFIERRRVAGSRSSF